MAKREPIWQGVQGLRQRPALVLAEITWRWCFAAGAWFVVAVVALDYLGSVPVTWREQLLLNSGQPLLALGAVAHSLRGSAGRLAAGIIVAGTAVAVLWMFAATLGRLATLNALWPAKGVRGSWPSLLGLSFLRAGLFLAAVLAALGGWILASFAGSPEHAGASVVIAVALTATLWVVWAVLNWLLSLAAIFAVRGRDTFGSIASAVEFIRASFATVVLTSLPFVLLHYIALAAAVLSGVLVSDLVVRVSAAAVWALVAVVAGYLAYVDFLYVARLAAYVAMVVPEGENVIPTVASPQPGAQTSASGLPDIAGSALGGTRVPET